ncbi:MAG: alpha-isopropylmalate synthase regulatory domain-containing protein, partial [Sulfurimonas sp.]|nr:alpha-isopropylmalate synthase regulatory domain-containing protein [Sulfurimonas sp.]
VSTCTLVYNYKGREIVASAQGNGPIDACKNALMKDYENEFTINSYSEHSCGDKSSAKAIAYIEIQTKDILSCFGVGIDDDIATASIKAMFSALNRTFTH